MKTIYIVSVIVLLGVCTTISVCRPDIIGGNKFLNDFVEHDILGIVGLMMTIAIPSIATIHIWFNELEVKSRSRIFGSARHEINSDALFLIWIFLILLVLLFLRSSFSTHQMVVSLSNGFAMVLLFCSVLTLLDILRVIKSLTPDN